MIKWKYKLVPARGTILVILPHPDDEIIGCGGTLLKHLMLGDNVNLLFLTNGVEYGDEFEARKAIRIAECKKVINELNVNAYIWEENVTVDCCETNIKRLANIICDLKPDIIYIPFIGERNKDHRNAAILLQEALLKMTSLQCFICEYSVWSPINPNILVNITEFFSNKMSLLRFYKSELAKYNYMKLIEGAGRYYLNLYHPDKNNIRILIDERRLFGEAALTWDYAEPFILSNIENYILQCESYK